MELSPEVTLPFLLVWFLTISLGFYSLWKALRFFFEWPVALAVSLLTVCATNYFSGIVYPSVNHGIYLFTLNTLVFWLTLLWQQHRQWWLLALITPVALTISWISAPGILILLFPVFTVIKTMPPLRKFFNSDVNRGEHPVSLVLFMTLLLSASFCITMLCPSDDPGRSFNFVPFNLNLLLFSIQNGWIVYTPLVVFAFIGFYWFAAEEEWWLYPALLYMVGSLFFAGGESRTIFDHSLGNPLMVGTYAVLALPLGFLVLKIRHYGRLSRIFMIIVSVLLISLNLLQTWQLRQSILVPGRMTGHYYFAIFGKVKTSAEMNTMILPVMKYVSDTIPTELRMDCKTLKMIDFETDQADFGESLRKDHVHAGHHSLLLNSGKRFSPGLSVPIREITQQDSSWISAAGYFRYHCPSSVNKAFLVITCVRNGVPYKYKTMDLTDKQYFKNQWNQVKMTYLIPFKVDPNDLIQVYFMNYGDEDLWVDDFRIDLCKPILKP